MKIALVQTNPVIGAFERNLQQIQAWLEKARLAECDLVVFPELTLCGYPPQDLLERSTFLEAHDRALQDFLSLCGGLSCVIGVPELRRGPGKPLYNSALLIEGGRVVFRARKQLLPAYDVFDESRYFEPGEPPLAFPFRDQRIGLSVCEDIWSGPLGYPLDPVSEMVAAGRPDMLINISASPYYHGKIEERLRVFRDLCRTQGLPLLYVNQVGGQDSLLFDGHSLVMDREGRVCQVAAGFAEDMLVIDTLDPGEWDPVLNLSDSIDHVFAGLVMGTRDYLRKIGFRKAVIGLSGGIDSAVTAVIACAALGADNVLCVAMPSPYTSRASVDDARNLAGNLGCGFELLPIHRVMEACRETLAPMFAGLADDVTEQNIQARIRGNLLMALSNKFGHLLLSTGNKSELAVGYCTLYGDMSGGLAVLADVPKVMVYELARWINRDREIIPERILTRPPTAELKPDQCDQDDLPPYEVLDPILEAYLEENRSVDEIVAQGFDRAVVCDVIRRIKRNEYKRKQAPLGLKVTSKAFGYGRRYPIVQGFVEE
ncbi:NAD+ synthase [Desulfolithobacter sp.]